MTVPTVDAPRVISLEEQLKWLTELGTKLGARVAELEKHNPYHPASLEDARRDLERVRAVWATVYKARKGGQLRSAREAAGVPPTEPPAPASSRRRDWSSGRSAGRRPNDHPDDRPRSSRRGSRHYEVPPGVPTAKCRSCGAGIHWVETPNGKKMPCDPDGRSHFETCPDAETYSRGGRGR